MGITGINGVLCIKTVNHGLGAIEHRGVTALTKLEATLLQS